MGEFLLLLIVLYSINEKNLVPKVKRAVHLVGLVIFAIFD